jgi:hypothetical protein
MIRTILNGVVFGLVVLLAGSGCLWPSPPKGTAVTPVALVPKLTPEEHSWQDWPRAQAALSQLPGVVNVHPGESTIHVVTENPSIVPAEFEGIRIETFTITKQKEPHQEGEKEGSDAPGVHAYRVYRSRHHAAT